jgi:homocysteine S-methyltransferase
MTEITLLDGSIGQELVKRSGDKPTPLWSTSVMIDHPDLVGAVHADYFKTGATIATTNTYAVHPNRLEHAGIPDQLDRLMTTATSQAMAARDAHGSGRVAGSMGPFLASYRPDLDPDPAVAAPRFKEMAQQMVGKVDILLAETVSSLGEAEGILRGVQGMDTPCWISFTVKDDDGTKLRSGENLSDIKPLLDRYAPAAVLVNCSRPEAFPAAMEILATTGLPFGGYANGFTHITDSFLEAAPTVAALKERTDLTPASYADLAMGWVDQGATIVGGCCEVGPAHITELAARLRAAGHEIV